MSNTSDQLSNGPADTNNPKFTQDGKNTRMAISNASQALQIARKLETDDDKRDFDRARVLAAFNGNPPYDEKEMLAAAQSYRFNVSFGFLEGLIGRATVPYFELVCDIDYIANIEADLPEHKLSIIRDELAETFKRWGKWNKFMSRLIQDLVLNGYNSVIFPSDYNPWPVFIPQKHGFVHEAAPNDAEDLELFVWKKGYLIHELYGHIADEKSAEKAGWNVENVRKALEKAVPEDVLKRSREGGWTAIESAIRGGTLFSSIVGGKQVETFHILACEDDGKVTHYVVWSGKTSDGSTEQSGIELFKREKRFPRMEDALVYFDLEPGDGKWHGSRGLGRRGFNTHRSIDKLRCSLLDQSFTSGLTLLQMADQSSQEDFQMVVTGPFAIIPPGISAANVELPAVSSTTFQADALLSATAEQRVGDIVPNAPSSLRQTRKTATEVQTTAGRQEAISKSNLMRFLDPLSKMLSIVLMRLIKESSPDPYAKEFQKRLANRGITREDLQKIRAARSTGKINIALGQDEEKSKVMFEEFRGDPDVDQIELKRRRMASVIGAKEVRGLLIEQDDKTRQIESVRAQLEELNTMFNGINIPVSPRDMHEYHLQVCLDWLEGQVMIQQQGKAGASFKIVDMIAGHAGQHLNFMRSDKTKAKIAKEYEARLQKVGEAIDQIINMASRTAKPGIEASMTPPPMEAQPPIV